MSGSPEIKVNLGMQFYLIQRRSYDTTYDPQTEECRCSHKSGR
jgi:hypothetical protein